MKMLNLGCGSRFHEDWTNLDFQSHDPHVKAHNLLEGIPYPDASFEVVYHSHVLEHFQKNDAVAFLRECHRVLKPGGMIRIAIPDLESIVDQYKIQLERASQGDHQAASNYDWILLEMYDQAVRHKGGGEMGKFLLHEKVTNPEFVESRIGTFLNALRDSQNQKSKLRRLVEENWLLSRLYGFAQWVREKIHRIPAVHYYRVGKFRLSGEIHQWMYDRYSLSRLLKEIGFQDSKPVSATESKIQGWKSFDLDTDPDGKIYKPDSLYMEATKPRS